MTVDVRLTKSDELDAAELDEEEARIEPTAASRRPVLTPRWVDRLLAGSLVVAIAALGFSAWFFFALFRPSQEIDPQTEVQVLKVATDGTIAVLSYSPATLEADFAKAESFLTGDFLAYYDKFTTDMVTPAAEEAQTTSSAGVIRKAVMDMQPTSATVLLFVNQSTSNSANPEPGLTSSVVKVELTKVNDTWLISELGPV